MSIAKHMRKYWCQGELTVLIIVLKSWRLNEYKKKKAMPTSR